ncbi:hypothetical protein THAOC_23024, partial [Thalassiosira oceanica]
GWLFGLLLEELSVACRVRNGPVGIRSSQARALTHGVGGSMFGRQHSTLMLDRWADRRLPTQSEGGHGVGGAVDATQALPRYEGRKNPCLQNLPEYNKSGGKLQAGKLRLALLARLLLCVYDDGGLGLGLGTLLAALAAIAGWDLLEFWKSVAVPQTRVGKPGSAQRQRELEKMLRTSQRCAEGSPNARQRGNRDVVYIGDSARRQRVRQSMRDRNGRPATSCPDRVRIERQFKAMEDLQDVTFVSSPLLIDMSFGPFLHPALLTRSTCQVVTNENLEWVVDDERDDNSSSAADDEGCMPAKPQCHLVLPDAGICKPCGSISNNDSDRMCRRRANECTICFTEYDVGDVIVCSKHCRHVFHQECMLEWLSRGNHNCPTCRSTFYVPTDIKEDSFDEGEMSMQERQRLAFRRVDLIQEVTDH